jgi:predicted phage-related endonuclease
MSDQLTRDQWLRERSTFVGASEVAAIMNLPGAYANIGELWLSKVKAQEQLGGEEEDAAIVDPETAAKFDRKSIGLVLEPAILTLYELRNPELKVRRNGLQIWRHPEYPFIGATLDAEAVSEFGDKRTVEAKNVSAFVRKEWGDEGSDEVPAIFAAQGVQQMLVREHLGYDTFCDFAAFFGGNDLKIFPVAYDRELAAQIIELVGWFWGLVQRRKAPPMNYGWKDATKLQKRIYDKIVGEKLVITEPAQQAHILDLIARRDRAHAEGLYWVGDERHPGVKGECTAELLAIAGNYGRVEIPIEIDGNVKTIAMNRRQKAGYEVAAFSVEPTITLTFEPFKIDKRQELLNEVIEAKQIEQFGPPEGAIAAEEGCPAKLAEAETNNDAV